MAGRPKGAQTGGRTCGRCRQKFQRRPGEAGEAFCPSCRTTDRRRRRTHPARDQQRPPQPPPPEKTADYPGAEWAPSERQAMWTILLSLILVLLLIIGLSSVMLSSTISQGEEPDGDHANDHLRRPQTPR